MEKPFSTSQICFLCLVSQTMWALVFCLCQPVWNTLRYFSPQDVKCADLFLSLRAYSLYGVKNKKVTVCVCMHVFSVPLHKSVGRERPCTPTPRPFRRSAHLYNPVNLFFFSFFWGETERKMDVLMKWLKDYLLTCCVPCVSVGLWDSHAGGKKKYR